VISLSRRRGDTTLVRDGRWKKKRGGFKLRSQKRRRGELSPSISTAIPIGKGRGEAQSPEGNVQPTCRGITKNDATPREKNKARLLERKSIDSALNSGKKKEKRERMPLLRNFFSRRGSDRGGRKGRRTTSCSAYIFSRGERASRTGREEEEKEKNGEEKSH